MRVIGDIAMNFAQQILKVTYDSMLLQFSYKYYDSVDYYHLILFFSLISMKIYDVFKDACPEGFNDEEGISVFERNKIREHYCYDKTQPCCITGYVKPCDSNCARTKCMENGGNWIAKDYRYNPYTCKMGNYKQYSLFRLLIILLFFH